MESMVGGSIGPFQMTLELSDNDHGGLDPQSIGGERAFINRPR